MRAGASRTGARSGVVAGLVALLATATPVRAEAPAPGPDAVVARVGAYAITAGELDARLAPIPPFQLRSLGSTPQEIRRAFLERVVLRNLLLAQGAQAESLDTRHDVAERVNRVLRGAMLEDLRVESANVDPVSDADVKAYFDANPERYRTPPRIALWRILVPTKEAAIEVIEAAKKDLSLKSWNELARDRSIDKATNLRGGNLGFVAPDGTTGDVGLKVDPTLFLAAAAVKDTELVPAPVKEGANYAVVWRRQSMREVVRTLEQETPGIRQLLAHERAEKRVKDLVGKLRTDHLSELTPELVDQIDITSTGDIQPLRRPGSLPVGRGRAAAPPTPKQTPGGLR